MSEFLAEAAVRVRPDTTAFRAELLAQIQAATRGVAAAVPVLVGGRAAGAQVAASLSAATVAQEELAATGLQAAQAERVLQTQLARGAVLLPQVTAQTAAYGTVQARTTAATAANAAAQTALTQRLAGVAAANTAAARSTHAFNISQATAARGVAATALSLGGVRGATLAASGSFLAGAAAAALFFKSVGVAASLERELNVFRVTAQATGDEMQRVAAEARALGRDVTLPGVSVGDAAQAMTELAKAGLDVQESIDAARGVLQLATAAGIENAQATELVANALNAFGRQGGDAVRVADLLAGASIAAQGSIVDMGTALQQAAAVARQVGFSLEDTVAFIALLAKAGLRGSDAGTSLRTALIRLINPIQKAREEIRSLGIEIRDLSGAVRPDVFDQFAQATRNLSPAMRDAALATIFGQDAIRAAAILARSGAAGLDEMRQQTQRAGSAAELAGARTAGFSGKIEGLKNTLFSLAENIGSTVIPVLGGLVDVLNLTVQATDALVAAAKRDASATADSFAQIAGPVKEASDAVDKFVLDALGLGKSGAAVALGLAPSNEQIERMRQELRENLSPALKEVTRDTRGYEVSLTDAHGRSRDLVNVTGLLASAFADAASRARLAGEQIRAAFSGLTAAQVLGQIGGLEERILDIRAAGAGPAAELPVLREEEQRLRRRLERPGLALAGRRKLKRELDRVLREIESIEEGIASEAERHARDVERARSKADQAFIASLGLRQRRLETAVIAAQATASLQDDIRRNEALRGFFRRSIEQARKTIRDARERAETIAALQRGQIQAEQEIERLRAEQRARRRRALEADIEFAELSGNLRRADALRARLIALLQNEIKGVRRETEAWRELRNEIARLEREREERRFDERRRALELNIEFAEITGNRRAEIRAREAEIRLLREQQRRTRRGTNEWRQLRNEIARQREELKRLKGERDRFRELTFQFLQTQQGFAATLLSNLIPFGAAAGTVGGAGGPTQGLALPTVSPAQGLTQATALAEARERGGVTSGQAATEIQILRQILAVLRDLHRGTGHPESQYQQLSSRAMLDLLG